MPIEFAYLGDGTILSGGTMNLNGAKAIVDIFGAFIRTTYPTPSSSQYLRARGAAYASTATVLASGAQWQQYTGSGNSTQHLLGASFANTALTDQAACDAYAQIGFSYQRVRLTADSLPGADDAAKQVNSTYV